MLRVGMMVTGPLVGNEDRVPQAFTELGQAPHGPHLLGGFNGSWCKA